MANSKPVKPSKIQVKDAENLWASFTQMMKYSVIVTVGILAVMAIVFVQW